MPDEEKKKYKLLAYGIERAELTPPKKSINSPIYALEFEPFNAPKRFNDYDGVILFNGIFERFKYYTNGNFRTRVDHRYDKDELDKRKKEYSLLLKKSGFICFIIGCPFFDRYHTIDDDQDFENTDLCKCALNMPDFYRTDIERATSIKSCINGFDEFFSIFGAASATFKKSVGFTGVRELANLGSDLCGIIIDNHQFFVPAMIPDNMPGKIEEYFSLLCEALVATVNKLAVSIPQWAEEFQSPNESNILHEKSKIEKRQLELNGFLNNYNKLKRILFSSGDALVEDIRHFFQSCFSIKSIKMAELKEDLQIKDETGRPKIFVEVKGTNEGVKRDYISQADSHRDRAGLDPDFPTLLIINTNIKKSRNLKEKDQTVAPEQIKYAVTQNILIIRTLDLFYLLHQFEGGKITKEKIMEIFIKEHGWLRVDEKSWEIIAD